MAICPRAFLDRLGKGGFRYLLEHGTHYANAHYRHANTETAVGHATLFTGADPSRHGIIANDWIDSRTGAFVYNTEDDRHHLIGKDPKPHKGMSPRNLLASTIGDELVVHNAGRSRVFSVSIKDRGAILPGGHAGKAYWYSKSTGDFVTSTYYHDAYPEWVTAGMARSWRIAIAASAGSCCTIDRPTSPPRSTIAPSRRIFHPWAGPFRTSWETTSISTCA